MSELLFYVNVLTLRKEEKNFLTFFFAFLLLQRLHTKVDISLL